MRVLTLVACALVAWLLRSSRRCPTAASSAATTAPARPGFICAERRPLLPARCAARSRQRHLHARHLRSAGQELRRRLEWLRRDGELRDLRRPQQLRRRRARQRLRLHTARRARTRAGTAASPPTAAAPPQLRRTVPGGPELRRRRRANVCGSRVCVPTTARRQGKNCGTISDGCGGTLELRQLHRAADLRWRHHGMANVCGCTPTTCAGLGKSCGIVPDGCGAMLNCGTCAAPATCGGGGTLNVCGCVADDVQRQGLGLRHRSRRLRRHAELRRRRGLFHSCGGGGQNRAASAAARRRSCTAQGKNCGVISDGCANILSCGTCPANQVCGGGGVANVCG